MNGILKYSIVALIGFSTVARADLEFDWSGSAFFSERQKVGGMWQITVRTVGSPAMTLRIEADGTEEKIRYIRVQAEAPTPGQCQLIVQGINGGKVVRVEEISWIPASSNKADLWINVLDIDKDSLGGEGGLGTGSGGSVEAHVIGAVNVEGDVTADLATLPNPVAGYSRINNVAVEGDLLGNVASQEEIISLEVTGDIGSSTNTVSISAGDHVDSIVAANIWADIEIGESIHVLRTPGTAGDFNGSLETGDVGGAISPIGIQISRDINADLTISGDITKPIKAGRSLNGDISIAGDLLDQVFINWYTGGSWSGDVTVGSTTLSPKGAYTQTGLGGGAVGLAHSTCTSRTAIRPTPARRGRPPAPPHSTSTSFTMAPSSTTGAALPSWSSAIPAPTAICRAVRAA